MKVQKSLRNQEEEQDPQWSADGDELFFLKPNGQLAAVDITTDGPFAFGTERPLPVQGFCVQEAYRNYAVTPDDQRFLVALPLDGTGTAGTARPQSNIGFNWDQELLERVPVP